MVTAILEIRLGVWSWGNIRAHAQASRSLETHSPAPLLLFSEPVLERLFEGLRPMTFLRQENTRAMGNPFSPIVK